MKHGVIALPMKTIVERAYDYADEKWGDVDEYRADTVAVSAYIAGAEDQKRIELDKVCEWLRARNILSEASLEEFRKAMEE